MAATAIQSPKFSSEFLAVVESLQQDYEHDDAAEYAAQIHCTPFVKRKIKPEWDDAPYKFPAQTLGDVIEFLMQDRSRQYSYHRETGSRFAWYVKAYPDINGEGNGDYKRNPDLDEAWEKYLQGRAGQRVWERAFEDAQEYYRTDWNSYPGDDQGDWKFAFGGRSGGWLCLQEWRGYKFARMSESELAEFVAGLVHHHLAGDGKTDFLEAFYTGIVCADQDFTGKNASANVTYHYAQAREEWETERGNLADQIEVAMRCAAVHVLEEHGLQLDDSDKFQALLRDVALLADTVER